MVSDRMPLVTVVIPCDDDTHLDATLASLAAQVSAPTFEVVVAGPDERRLSSTISAWEPLLDVRVVASRPGTAPAVRNTGVGAARGSLLVFVDADDTVSGNYVRAMADALGTHPVVCGRIDLALLNPWNEPSTHPQETGLITTELAYRPFAGAGTLGMRRAVFDEIGGWDASLRYYEEADLCWRLEGAGYGPPVLVRDAILHVRLQSRAMVRWRRTFTRGSMQALLYRRYRDDRMARESISNVLHAWSGLVIGSARRAVGQPVRNLGWHSAIRLGRLWGSLRYRVLYL